MRRISVRGMVIRDNKLLCVQLKAYKDSLRTDRPAYWCLPGGGLDEGEALVAGLEREMIEETGIAPKIGNLLYVQQFAFGEKEYLEFFFHITNSEDYLQIDLAKTTHGQEEIAKIDFIDPTASYVLPEFLSVEKIQEFADSQAPTKIISFL